MEGGEEAVWKGEIIIVDDERDDISREPKSAPDIAVWVPDFCQRHHGLLS